MTLKGALLAGLALVGVAFTAVWVRVARRHPFARPGPAHLGIGWLTDFLDTLGIGSFATTTTAFRLGRLVDDRKIPGTLNVGHTLPTIVQALIYITIVDVDAVTLASLVAASVLGAVLGAGIVVKLPLRGIRGVMGVALILAGALMAGSALSVLPKGGDALSLSGTKLVVGIVANGVLGALMTAGIGLYGPCMVLVALLGMSPAAAFPIMMGSCAFLMPSASFRFLREGAYDGTAALGLTLAGIFGVLVAAYVVRSLPLDVLRILVLGVVLYTAVTLLVAASKDDAAPVKAPRESNEDR
ncbi:MAG TPA: sulfite exporter TauE/SafE family protein [Polyangiaceae bacterium]|nr:sulfite exporter TauE/SafE family protein [Polyangiaceae bacterium]